MSLAPQELENSARRYAAEAIKFDSQGSRGLAVQAYQRAVDVLVKLIQLYPDYKLNKIYMQRASTYQNRIKALQMLSMLDYIIVVLHNIRLQYYQLFPVIFDI
jgi:hypothetical protein